VNERRAEAERLRRVLVALDPMEQCREALDAAARLAARHHAELVGLFVEDLELLAAAALPSARLVGGGGTEEPLDAARLEQGLRVWAARARAALAAAAARWQVPAEFRTVRGAVAEQLLAEARAFDLLALGTVARPSKGRRVGSTARLVIERASCSVMMTCRPSRAGQPLVVLYEDFARTLSLGAELAQTYGAPLLVLAAGADEAAAQGSAQQATAWLQERNLEGQVERIVGTSVAALYERLDRRPASLLVFDRRGALGAKLDLASVLDGRASTVFVLGAEPETKAA